MNKTRSTTFVISMLAVFGFTAVIQPVSAGVEAECRQEAEDYEVMPELRNDYINGCIESRGGASTSSSVEEGYVPPSEADDTSNPVPESENVAE